EVQLRDKTTLAAAFPIELGEERAVGTLELRMDPTSDLLTASLVVMPEVGSTAHSYALRFGLAPEGREVFVPGTGGAVEGTMDGKTIVVDDDTHPFAIVSTQGALAITEVQPDGDQPSAQPRVSVSARTESSGERAVGGVGRPARLDLSVLVGTSSREVW